MRSKVNLSIDDSAVPEAREFGVKNSRVAETARLERNRRWREENREALEAYAGEMEQGGLALARFRSF